MAWIIILVLIFIIGFLLDREIYFYEGAHLGPRLQSWLYDRWSKNYDTGKQDSQIRDDEILARPLLERLNTSQSVSEPFILDFATGTGRMSFALLMRPEFKGKIIALDISQGMLEQAAHKLSRASTAGYIPPLGARVELLCHQSMPLPFPNATFDAVCCLEVLELLPNAQAALDEMSRLLRPGGILLMSRGTEESGRKAKVKSEAELTSILRNSGFENIQITKWWKLFDRVLAIKNGTSSPAGAKSLTEVLKCSSCGQTRWSRTSNMLKCEHCGRKLSITPEQVVLN